MTATIKSRSTSRVNTAVGIDTRVGLISMGVASALIGAWALASMVGAVMTNGIGGVLSGFVSALIG